MKVFCLKVPAIRSSNDYLNLYECHSLDDMEIESSDRLEWLGSDWHEGDSASVS